jgi:toxin ParE1/3/4
MAKVVWTEPALSDLDAIADYIALDNPRAARDFVRRVFVHVEQLAAHPKSGSKPPELRGWRYRQVVEPPCRVFYRHDNGRVLILYVMRSERRLRPRLLAVRGKRVQRG